MSEIRQTGPEQKPEQKHPSLPETPEELYTDFSEWLVARGGVLDTEIEAHDAEEPGKFAEFSVRLEHAHKKAVLGGRRAELTHILDRLVHYDAEQ